MYFHTQLKGNSKAFLPAVNQLHTLNRKNIDRSSPKIYIYNDIHKE